MSNFKFKQENSLQDRLHESQRITAKYADRIPIICEKNSRSKNTPPIDKTKYLVPNDLTIGQFVYVIRKRMQLAPEKAIFIFIGNNIPPSSQRLIDTYYFHRDEDGFLYISYSCENTFGM